MKKGIRQALALLLVLAMTCTFAFAAVEDEFNDRDNGKRGNWPTNLGMELLVIFPRYELTLEKGSKTVVTGVVEGADPNATYFWRSSNEKIVKVDGTGIKGTVEAVGAGTAKVKLTVFNPDGVYDYDILTLTVKDAASPVTVEGGKNLTMTAGESMNLAASVSGGSGSYSYDWDCYGAISLTDHMRQNATIYAGKSGEGVVYLTVTDGEDPSNNATTTWNVTVASTKTAPSAGLDKTDISMAPGESSSLTMTATGGSGNYQYFWESDNPGVAVVSGSGSTVKVIAAQALIPGVNTAQIRAAVVDAETGLRSDVLVCRISVSGGSANYDVSVSTSLGTNMSMNDVAKKIADQYKQKFGADLGFGAGVRLTASSTSVGSLQLQDGSPVSPHVGYVYATLQDMIFYPETSGTFSTEYTITDNGRTISGIITITVAGGIGVRSATLDNSKLKMETYSSQFLNLTVMPRNAGYTVRWISDNERIVVVSGSGNYATVQSGGTAGKAIVTAIVTDVNGAVINSTCEVTVTGHEKTDSYNPTLTVTMGSDYYGTSVSDSLASRFKSTFGITLGANAVIRFTSVEASPYGTLRLYNGKAVRANQDYTFQDLVYMYFEANAAGTYTLPYELSYQDCKISGTISVFVRAASIAVTLDPENIVLSPYSNQSITLTTSPVNAFYKVEWISSDPDVVSIKGAGNMATVYSTNRTGVVTVTAVVTDAGGAEIRRSCTVQVISKANTYDPSVSTTLGVAYTGTGTSTAMRNQFYDLYGVKLDDKAATITFASTGNNDVGVLRLPDGSPIRANVQYTFEEYVKMYTQPVATGVFSFPYTLTYSGRTLTGTVSVTIKASEIDVSLKMESGDPYQFNEDLGKTSGGAILIDAIENTVGSSWSYLRFSKFSDDTGTLYLDKKGTALKTTTDVDAFDIASLYFKPGALTGTFTATFTVYNAKGGVLGTGRLNIVKEAITFVDVPSNAYYASAVSWAVSKGITSGTDSSHFSPDVQVSRGQAVAFLWRAAGQPKATIKENSFKDVKAGDYYYEAVLWAVQQGITQGTSATTFSPNATLNRDQLLTFLCRANGGHADGSDWSKLAVSWATGRGLLEGIPGTFVAGAPCPRSEVVYYLWKDAVG